MFKKYRVIKEGEYYIVQVCKWYLPFWLDVPDRRNGYSFTNLFRSIDKAIELLTADKEGWNLSTVVYKDLNE